MTTQWDDDRIFARVEDREPTGHQREIEDALGLIVRVYDRGPADGRLNDPVLVFDSEQTHGSLGVWGDEQEAREFADTCREGWLVCARTREALRHDRLEHLGARSLECKQRRDEAKAEAKAASKRAKEAQAEDDLLAEEAENPQVELVCPPGARGWTVYAMPALSDGNLDGERRELALGGATPENPLDALPVVPQVKAQQEIKRRRGRRRAPPRLGEPLTPSVPDANGLPLSPGTRVKTHDAETGEVFSATVEEIRGEVEGGWEIVLEPEDAEERGLPVVLSTEVWQEPDGDAPAA